MPNQDGTGPIGSRRSRKGMGFCGGSRNFSPRARCGGITVGGYSNGADSATDDLVRRKEVLEEELARVNDLLAKK